MNSKGQSAAEYMMTYGWAILVIIGIGVAMWQAGILNLGQDTTPGNRGFSQVTPLDWNLKSDGSLTVSFTNEAGVILNISSANATITAGGSGACSGSVSGVPLSIYRPAQTVTITFSSCPVTEAVGEYYRAEVGVVYENPSSGIEHVSYGKIWGGIE